MVHVAADVHHHREERVGRVRALGACHGVAQLELKGEDDAVRQLALPSWGGMDRVGFVVWGEGRKGEREGVSAGRRGEPAGCCLLTGAYFAPSLFTC